MNWWKIDEANPTGPRVFSHVAAHAADGYELEPGERWTSSIHMLRAASRILLEIVGVRVERLQNISEADALSEGITYDRLPNNGLDPTRARTWYRGLWETINGAGSYSTNPWVWVCGI